MNYAIVIGIDHYEKSPLSAAVSDAKAFAKWLIDKKLVANSTKTLKLLLSEETNDIADSKSIDMAIQSIILDAKNHTTERNRLYFYFAGHGIGVTFKNTALCLRLWPDWFNDCISGSDYMTWFTNKGVFDEILMFFDCCRDFDQLIKAGSPRPDWQTLIGNKQPNILICNSTLYGKLSYEIGSNEKRGAFTSFLIQSLNGDADKNRTGRITSNDLKQHINKNFETYALNNGKFQKGDVSTEGQNGDEILICEVDTTAPATTFNYEIEFTRNSKVTLRGKNTEIIRTGDVTVGEKWSFKLEQGFHVITDEKTGEQKLISNYSENTMSHDVF